MNLKPQRRLSLLPALLVVLAMGGAGGGCGPAELGETESVAQAAAICGVQNETLYAPPRYGSSDGHEQGWNCEVGGFHPVTYITAYADSERIYGIELKWGTTTTKLYGQTNGMDPQVRDYTDEPVVKIKVCVDSDGDLSGIRFVGTSEANSPFDLGRLCGEQNQTVYDDVDSWFVNMRTFRGTYLRGVRFAYLGGH